MVMNTSILYIVLKFYKTDFRNSFPGTTRNMSKYERQSRYTGIFYAARIAVYTVDLYFDKLLKVIYELDKMLIITTYHGILVRCINQINKQRKQMLINT